MTDPQPTTGIGGLPVSVWIALILGVVGVFALRQNPFQDTRPPNTAVPVNHHSVDDGETIEARLWEDPMSAVAAALAHGGRGQSASNVHKLSARIQENIDNHARTLVLGVMVTGEPYTDDMEIRRRTRYAVLAGLYRSGLVPVNSDHIGYLVRRSAPTNTSQAAGRQDKGTGADVDADTDGSRHITAFEWFNRDNADHGDKTGMAAGSPVTTGPSQSDQVLVLWLDQDEFRDLPLRSLSGLFRSIAAQDTALVRFAVLGPASSDGLHAMYVEAQQIRQTNSAPALRRMDFYSSRATASDRSITNNGGKLSDAISDSTQQRVRLFRTVADDQAVEEQVYAELGRRGIHKYGRIALVAERDTLYARSMGDYFNKCGNRPSNDPAQPFTIDPGAEPTHPICFTYLKGLDGLAPTAPPPASPSATPQSQPPDNSSTQSATTSSPSVISDEATGPSQLDYLRRLAATIAALRQSGTRIKAIGVISSDVYDKLLVLQALRNELPSATYFTFDLDARLVDPKNLRWTRQLIVGSSLGLALTPDLQGDIPSFRDSYQTSTYFATMLSLHRFVSTGESDTVDPNADPQAGLQWTAWPRVFVIGRSQEFDVTPRDPRLDPGNTHSARNSPVKCQLDAECYSISTNRQSWFWNRTFIWAKSLWVGGGLALLSLAAAALAIGVRGLVGLSRTHSIPLIGERRWSNWISSVSLAVAVIVLTVLLWPSFASHVTNDYSTVPTPLFSGANRWISGAVDLVAIITVVLLVVRGQRKLHDNAECVGREFGLNKTRRKLIKWHRDRRDEVLEKPANAAGIPTAQVNPATESRRGELPTWLTWCWFPLTAFSRRFGIDLADADVSEVEAIIAQYLHHGTAWARIRRAAPVTVFVVLCLVLPLEELAGIAHLGRWLDWISLGSLFAMQFLIFWTADALLLSRSFILALTRDKPAWPATSDTAGLPPKQGALWMDLLLVAARTRGVSGLVWYPSFVIAVMSVAALTIQFREFQFANNPIALVVGTLFVIGSAVALRRAAERLRREVIYALENDRLRAQDEHSGKQLKLLAERVDDLRQGAFAPYSEQPIVRAVLVPAATYGATLGLQHLRLGP